MTPLILSLAIPVVVLLIARVCYCWGFMDGQHKIEQVRVRNINALNRVAERLRVHPFTKILKDKHQPPNQL